MCGITGYINLDGAPASEELVRKLADKISHRGPDGQGWFIHENAALAHKRLAIIDLSDNAAQPMLSNDEMSVISYNGEIYNFKELRKQLENLGHKFNSGSDTEVVLCAFQEWGLNAIDRLNGMFAFSILCLRSNQLILARDRYGIKPLYYTLTDNVFLFASEIKAFLGHPYFKSKMDIDSLHEYMTFQNFFGENTLFKDVKLLPAGSTLSIDLTGKVSMPQRYWDFSFRESSIIPSREEAVEELNRLFVNAVKRQLVSDVPIGSYLSGGIDTGSITALASAACPGMRTFTIGFDTRSISGLELAYDERDRAEYMASLCKTEHYEMILKSGDMIRAIDELVWHLEEPRVGQSYPNFYAARLAGAHNKVVLSGAGGDELFAGYPWRYLRSASASSFLDYSKKYYEFWQRLVPSEYAKNILKDSDRNSKADMYQNFASVFGKAAEDILHPSDYINNSLYFEAKTFLQGLLLVEDKLSMAHGLEARVPFLDNELVDFAMQLPVSFKLSNVIANSEANENLPGAKTFRYRQSSEGKQILREVMAQYVPDRVTNAPKQGFSGPDASWFKGESIDYVHDTILNKNARIYDHLDFNTFSKLVKQHLEGTENRRLLVWSLLYLENWCRQFLVHAA